PELRKAMLDEPVALFERVVRAGGRLPELLTSSQSIATDDLARFYGVMGSPVERLADGTGRWDVSSMHRGGLLAPGAALGADAAGCWRRGRCWRRTRGRTRLHPWRGASWCASGCSARHCRRRRWAW